MIVLKRNLKSYILFSVLIIFITFFPISTFANNGYSISYYDSVDDYLANINNKTDEYVTNGSLPSDNYNFEFGDGYINQTEEYQPNYISDKSLGSDIIYITEQPTTELWSRNSLSNSYSVNQYRNGNTIQPITIVINGKKCTPRDTSAIVIDNRVFVPLRFVAEELGYAVSWDEENMVAEVNNGAVRIEVGSFTMWKYDSITVPTDTPPFFYQGTLMVGLRQIGNALNFDIKWDADKKIAYLERATPNNNLYQHNVFDRSK